MYLSRLDPSAVATYFHTETRPNPVRGRVFPAPRGETIPLDDEPMLHSTRPGVLVVDDEALIRSVLELGLKRSGFTAWQAASGPEAVTVYRAHQDEIALVILDVRMPGMNGLQTLKALKEVNPEVVVCFLTGDSGELTEEELMAHGAAAVLYKPFRLEDLITVLWGYVGEK
jgi:CheY-like chemotaxis protein